MNFDLAASIGFTSSVSKELMMKDIDFYLGLCAVCCATLTSGFACVYNEKLMKDGKQPSLLIRNIQLSNLFYKVIILRKRMNVPDLF